MLLEKTRCLKAAAQLSSQTVLLKELSRLSSHGGARRHFGISRPLAAKVPPPRKPRERVDIPGLEMVTYADRMHFVPGLTKPVGPRWERDYKDPRYYESPPAHEMPLFKETPCYVFNQRTSALEGNVTPPVARQCDVTGTTSQRSISGGLR